MIYLFYMGTSELHQRSEEAYITDGSLNVAEQGFNANTLGGIGSGETDLDGQSLHKTPWLAGSAVAQELVVVEQDFSSATQGNSIRGTADKNGLFFPGSDDDDDSDPGPGLFQ